MTDARRTAAAGIVVLVFVAVATLAGWQAPAASSPPTTSSQPGYTEIAPGFGFPREEQELLRYRDTQNAAVMRRHGWEVVFPIIRGQLGKQDPFYAGKPRLDLLWSLAFETQ